MQLLLSSHVMKRLYREMRRAGKKEVGGLLMGEHVRDELFRVVDISVQLSHGSESCFLRHPNLHQSDLQDFFTRTGENYNRFNYLGEWHSHPSFAPVPSITDVRTMQSIVEDLSVGANFLILLIAKLTRRKTLEVTATAFRSGTNPIVVPVSAEDDCKIDLTSTVQRWLSGFFIH